MTARLPTHMIVTALVRRTNITGGFATVVARGDPMSGALLIQLAPQGLHMAFFERVTDLDGKRSIVRCGPSSSAQQIEINEYIERRRYTDPDLWLIELDIADGERFAAETMNLC